MKRILIVSVLVCFSAFLFAQADPLLGKWLVQSKKSHIEIFKSNGKYYGKIVWIKEPLNADGTPKLDKDNEKPELRSRQLMGLHMLSDFIRSNEREYSKGTIYNPEDGKTYSCNLTLENNGQTLRVRGYVGLPLFGKTQIWTRVN